MKLGLPAPDRQEATLVNEIDGPIGGAGVYLSGVSVISRSQKYVLSSMTLSVSKVKS